jgi:site-specific DNA-adenine methylase
MRLPLFIIKTAGTKSWLVGYALEFLGNWYPKTIVEPFAGSCVLGLSLLNEGFTERLVLAEKDTDYRAFWKIALSDPGFSYRVAKWTEHVFDRPFSQQRPFVEASLERMKAQDPGFWILLRSRVGFNGRKVGGFMTEHGRGGILCRWPRSLAASLDLLYTLRRKITILLDGFEALVEFNSQDAYAFIDPPFTLTKKCPGHQLYEEPLIDHHALLSLAMNWKGRLQLIYNDSRATREFLGPFVNGMTGTVKQKRLLMNSGSGKGGSKKKWELLISRVPSGAGEGAGGTAEETARRYWLTPPDLYEKLDAEFHFDFDPCPYPRPDAYDGLEVEWGQSTYCNPSFRKKDSPRGGPTAFVRKGILEAQKGKTVVFALPAQSYIGRLIEAGAELRFAGRVKWLEADSKKPCPSPSPIVLAILRPRGRKWITQDGDRQHSDSLARRARGRVFLVEGCL